MTEEEYVAQGARYFVCEFSQHTMGWDEGKLFVRRVHRGYEQYEAAKKIADDLETSYYRTDDFNVQVVARLAFSADDAKQQHFLDD